MCSICLKVPCYPRCPNYIEPKSKYVCSLCDKGIQCEEEYIENDDGDYAHWDCIDSKWELAKFLNYEITEMEDECYE